MECPGCRDYEQLSRRRFMGSALGAGAGTFLGLLRPEILYAQNKGPGQARNVILLWMGGGQSHLDTWDPKPGTDNGGPFQAIETAAKGIRISEHLPLIARQFKDLSLIRSLTSKEGSHERATYLMHTGYMPIPSFQHATLGSTAWKVLGKINQDLPAYVTIGRQSYPAGHLGAAFAPFQVQNPDRPAENVAYHYSVTDDRFRARLELASVFDAKFRQSHPGNEVIEAYRQHYLAARDMMFSPGVKAFDLAPEPDAVRSAYGFNYFGQGCLLARRLVQAGVRFIEVNMGGWDTHQNNFERVMELSGELDQAVSALVADLKRNELLGKTLLLVVSEFGRTPRITGENGRDHHPRVWSCALAGGGIVGGRVIGASTDDGEGVKDRPVSIPELHATICKALGIDPYTSFRSPDGRPIRIVQNDQVQPVSELFS